MMDMKMDQDKMKQEILAEIMAAMDERMGKKLSPDEQMSEVPAPEPSAGEIADVEIEEPEMELDVASADTQYGDTDVEEVEEGPEAFKVPGRLKRLMKDKLKA